MTTPASKFLSAAQERGFIHQCTDMTGLDELACKGPIPAYIGFDATADSLHAGSLVPIMLLWVNSHGSYLLGFLLPPLFWTSAAFEISRPSIEKSLSCSPTVTA